MANVRSANTYHVDGTASTLDIKGIKVTHILVAVSTANAVLVLSDVTTGNKKLEIRLATDESTEFYDFSDNPIVFPNGINPSTVTNCVATLMLDESRG